MKQLDGRIAGSSHVRWSASNPPIVRVRSGDSLEIEVPDSSTMQLNRGSTTADLVAVDMDRVDAAVGPIWVDGAKPGQTLAVEILSIDVGDWGWSAVFRQFGFLKERFDDDLVIWSIRDGAARPVSGFLRPISLPLAPMLGVLGVAPASGSLPMIPPGPFGGNMDSTYVRAGTTVRLPIFQEGALLSVGDPHALQGDGEVCGTGIETPARVRLRVSVRPEPGGIGPSFEVPAHRTESPEVFVTTGIDSDLESAVRTSLKAMIGTMEANGWTAKEAYLLCSLIGHLTISEVVDDPNRLVSFAVARQWLAPPSAGP